jgi:hypothetical protein
VLTPNATAWVGLGLAPIIWHISMQQMARKAGWTTLVSRYRYASQASTPILKRQVTGLGAGIRMGGIAIAILPDGLVIKAPWLLRPWFPTLMLPWRVITSLRVSPPFTDSSYELTLDHSMSLWVRPEAYAIFEGHTLPRY